MSTMDKRFRRPKPMPLIKKALYNQYPNEFHAIAVIKLSATDAIRNMNTFLEYWTNEADAITQIRDDISNLCEVPSDAVEANRLNYWPLTVQRMHSSALLLHDMLARAHEPHRFINLRASLMTFFSGQHWAAFEVAAQQPVQPNGDTPQVLSTTEDSPNS